jgi:hypothetical protein
MILYVFGIPLSLLGLAMMTRGWIYTLRPDGPIAAKRKKKNLQKGFTTDMKVFGRKVRRVGLMTLLLGGFLVGWQLSHRADERGAATTTTTTPPAG